MSSPIAKCRTGLLKCGSALKIAERSILPAKNRRLQQIDPTILGSAFFAIVLFVVVPLDMADLSLLLLSFFGFYLIRPSALAKVLSTRYIEVVKGLKVSDIFEAEAMATRAPLGGLRFVSTNLDSDVVELLSRMKIDASALKKLHCLERKITGLISKRLPDAKVQVFANSNPDVMQAFATAIPEVSVVITSSLECLSRQNDPQNNSEPPVKERNARHWVKVGIRACADCLVSSGFKFRRSALRDDDPKLTFVSISHGYALDLFVNNNEPSKLKALLDHCTTHDPVAKELVLLVRFWARERGVAHTVSGALSPFAWVVLALFYLRVAPEVNGQGRRLATLGTYLRSLSANVESTTSADCNELCTVPVSTLFRGFLQFYSTEFDWNHEIVSLQGGIRQRHEKGVVGELARIENPFETTKDLAATFSGEALVRLREECERAHRLLDQGASLGQILEPWIPPQS